MTIRHRQKLFALTLFCVVSAGVVAFSFGKKHRSTTMLIHIKSIPDPEVVVLTSSDRHFYSTLESMSGERRSDIRQVVESAKPFCVFVQNSTNLGVVGLALEWQITNTDGTRESRGQGYSTPGALIGLTVLDPAMIGHTKLINEHSTSFISLDPDLKQIFDSQQALHIGSASHKDTEQLQAYALSLKNKYKQLLANAKEVDVIVDGVIFSDGSYRGFDKYQVILSTQALVQAKRDLSAHVDHAVRNNASITKLFQNLKHDIPALVESARGLPDTLLVNSDYDRLYRSYLDIYADELVGIANARGPAEAIKYSQEAFHRVWPSLHARRL
jgi:hypothetical protein